MEWDHRFRPLKFGEIILATDERLDSDHPWHGGNERWVMASPAEIGTPAPDPLFPAHRQFRRLVKEGRGDG